jgi:cytochrome c oxidase assembly protein subunit 15
MDANREGVSEGIIQPTSTPHLEGFARFSLPRSFLLALKLLLIFQVILVVTGGAVRLTGSGLGCPTWPDCFHGAISPVPHPAQGYHAWIEFGNRVLTVIDLVIILFVLLAVFTPTLKRVLGYKSEVTEIHAGINTGKNTETTKREIDQSKKRYKRIRFGSILQFAGFFAQAVLGGITVLTHLNPIPVSGHFLLSIYLIFAAHRLLRAASPSPPVPTHPLVVRLTRTLQVVTGLVIVIGTVVTGSGPHAGDISAKRYSFDPRVVSWFHADLVISLISLTVGLYLISHLTLRGKARALLNRKVVTFILLSLSQALVGYIQYFTGLPEILVGAHLLGACLIWIAVCELGTTVCAAKISG